MTKELEQLGGGEPRLGEAWVHCFVSLNPSASTGPSTLLTQQAGLCIRDPRNSHAASQAKLFHIKHSLDSTACQELQTSLSKVCICLCS